MAVSKHNHDACADGSGFEDEYFSRTYQPLSNLPTPPPSCRDSVASLSPRSLIEQDELLESALLGAFSQKLNVRGHPRGASATPSQ